MWTQLAAAALTAADQYARHRARQGMLPPTPPRSPVVLTRWDNDGLALGIGRNHPALTRVLPCLALTLATALAAPLFPRKSGLCRLGLSLCLWGGAGNAAERLYRGAVTDYLRFPRLPGRLKTLVWNLADLMILLGILLALPGAGEQKA